MVRPISKLTYNDGMPADVPSLRPGRLRRCRRFRHGLARAPVVKKPTPRGNGALLPCPKAGEGVCPYRRGRCTDEIQDRSRATTGVCEIERIHYERLVPSALAILDYKEGEVPGPEVLAAVRACCEALIFAERAQVYWGKVQVGEVKDPSPLSVVRYQSQGFSAWLNHMDNMVAARMTELRLDVERIRDETGGSFWAWWRESRRKPWMREQARLPDPTAA